MHGNYWLFIKTVVILILFCVCDIEAAWNTFRTTRDLKSASPNAMTKGSNRTGRGFFPHGGLFSLGKVLNFFPVGGERECQPSGLTLARAGICLNPYDCRQRDGKAAGDCAHGLGVCCVFEVSCGGTVQNNLTYFLSPRFPELWSGERDCSIKIEKSHAGIMQLRIDFVHFTIGQPNRSTGECDEDVMVISDGDNKSFTICGQNHGQHLYYTLSTTSESREADELPRSKATTLSIRMRGADMPRLWMLRIAQMPLAQSAPHECLQYHTDVNGTIKTFNYAVNGRHLTGQEYKACVRRNIGFCSIRYTPCDARSFRVGPSSDEPQFLTSDLGPGSQGGAGTGFYGPEGAYLPPNIMPSIPDQQVVDTQNDPVLEDGMMPADVQQDPETQADEMEGSGADPQIASTIEAPQPSLMSRIWNFIWPWSSSQRSWSWTRWSPYAQHYQEVDDQFPYRGYGNFGMGLQGRYGRQRCKDRITIPCDNEYFVMSSPYGPGVCDPHHCGGSFCPGLNYDHCHVETSITPFSVSFHFGPPTAKSNPEDNIGACLKYTQLPCEA